jgi:two-component system, OmpR family, response regulator TctD
MKLLIVGADAASEHALSGVLHALRLLHHVKRDTAEAWEALSERHYDAVILELHKPEQVDFVRLLRQRRAGSMPDRSTPLVVVSSRAKVQVRVLALEAGADLSVEKPCEATELVAMALAAARRRSGVPSGLMPPLVIRDTVHPACGEMGA